MIQKHQYKMNLFGVPSDVLKRLNDMRMNIRWLMVALTAFSCASMAQNEPYLFVGESGSFFIDEKTFLCINGSIKVNEKGNKTSILNGDIIVLGDSVVSSKPTTFFNAKSSVGNLVLAANKVQHLKNIDSLQQLVLENGSKKVLHSSLHLFDTLQLKNTSLEVKDNTTIELGLANAINFNQASLWGESSATPILLGSNSKIATHLSFNQNTVLSNIGMSFFPKTKGGSAIDIQVERSADTLNSVTDGSVKRVYKVFKWSEDAIELDSLVFQYHAPLENMHGNEPLSLFYSVDLGKTWEKNQSFSSNNPSKHTAANLNWDADTIWFTVAPSRCIKNPYSVDIANDSINLCDGNELIFTKDAQAVNHVWNQFIKEDTLKVDTSMAVNYAAINRKGCEATDRFNVFLREKPSSDFWVDKPIQGYCDGDTIKMIVINNNSDQINQYEWINTLGWSSSGDETSLTVKLSKDIAHTDTLTLMATNDFACQSSTSKLVYLFPKPKADFVYNLICGDSAVQLLNSSISNLEEQGMTYVWNLGFENKTITTSGLSPNPSPFFYPDSGRYQVTLQVENFVGCEASVAKTIYFPTIQSKGCDATNGNNGGGNNGNGGIGGGGNVLPSCRVVSPNSIKPVFLVASNAMAGDTLVMVQLSEPPADKYVWLLSDGRFDTVSVQKEWVFPRAADGYKVRMISIYPNCADTLEKSINIRPVPPQRTDWRPRRLLPDFDSEPTGDEPQFEGLWDARLFPNPVAHVLHLKLSKTEGVKVQIEWRNGMGETLFSENLIENEASWDVSGFVPGLYFVTIQMGYQTKNLKFIKL